MAAVPYPHRPPQWRRLADSVFELEERAEAVGLAFDAGQSWPLLMLTLASGTVVQIELTPEAARSLQAQLSAP